MKNKKLRKKYQHRVNHIVRDINKNIRNDFVWNGRFTVRQKQSRFHIYFDKSGAQLYVLLECKDNQTNKIITSWFKTSLFIESHIWEWVNQCIVEDFNVWAEKPNPLEQAKMRQNKF